MKKGDAFPSTYLGKDDLHEPMTATIADVRLEEISGDRGSTEDKPVMSFDNGMKSLIVNTTNWNTLEAAYGEDTDDWRGQPVELYVDPGVVYAGKRVGGVRVRVPSNGRKAAPAAGGEAWTLKEAIAKAAAAGIEQVELVARLKDAGRSGWNPQRDTPFVKGLISDNEEIPF